MKQILAGVTKNAKPIEIFLPSKAGLRVKPSLNGTPIPVTIYKAILDKRSNKYRTEVGVANLAEIEGASEINLSAAVEISINFGSMDDVENMKRIENMDDKNHPLHITAVFFHALDLLRRAKSTEAELAETIPSLVKFANDLEALNANIPMQVLDALRTITWGRLPAYNIRPPSGKAAKPPVQPSSVDLAITKDPLAYVEKVLNGDAPFPAAATLPLPEHILRIVSLIRVRNEIPAQVPASKLPAHFAVRLVAGKTEIAPVEPVRSADGQLGFMSDAQVKMMISAGDSKDLDHFSYRVMTWYTAGNIEVFSKTQQTPIDQLACAESQQTYINVREILENNPDPKNLSFPATVYLRTLANLPAILMMPNTTVILISAEYIERMRTKTGPEDIFRCGDFLVKNGTDADRKPCFRGDAFCFSWKASPIAPHFREDGTIDYFTADTNSVKSSICTFDAYAESLAPLGVIPDKSSSDAYYQFAPDLFSHLEGGIIGTVIPFHDGRLDKKGKSKLLASRCAATYGENEAHLQEANDQLLGKYRKTYKTFDEALEIVLPYFTYPEALGFTFKMPLWLPNPFTTLKGWAMPVSAATALSLLDQPGSPICANLEAMRPCGWGMTGTFNPEDKGKIQSTVYDSVVKNKIAFRAYVLELQSNAEITPTFWVIPTADFSRDKESGALFSAIIRNDDIAALTKFFDMIFSKEYNGRSVDRRALRRKFMDPLKLYPFTDPVTKQETDLLGEGDLRMSMFFGNDTVNLIYAVESNTDPVISRLDSAEKFAKECRYKLARMLAKIDPNVQIPENPNRPQQNGNASAHVRNYEEDDGGDDGNEVESTNGHTQQTSPAQPPSPLVSPADEETEFIGGYSHDDDADFENGAGEVVDVPKKKAAAAAPTKTSPGKRKRDESNDESEHDEDDNIDEPTTKNSREVHLAKKQKTRR